MGDEADALWDMADFDEEDFGEVVRRQVPRTKISPPTYGTKGITPRGVMADMQCHCGAEYKAREADLKRGWGYSCSKHCAAVRRDFGLKRAKRTSRHHRQQGAAQ